MNIIAIAMMLLKHRESIAKIVAMLPELKTIFAELNPPPATSTGYPVGSMEWLQESLNTLGAEPPLDVDGEYGPATNKAIHDYQSANGLKADGWAGPETISSIVAKLG